MSDFDSITPILRHQDNLDRLVGKLSNNCHVAYEVYVGARMAMNELTTDPSIKGYQGSREILAKMKAIEKRAYNIWRRLSYQELTESESGIDLPPLTVQGRLI